MMDILSLHGIILKSFDYSEYDRRLTVFTLERGKITVFARGVKRPGNRLMASTEPFCTGTFKVTEGKSAYNLRETEIDNFFEDLRKDLPAFYLGTYFLEFADYYSRENLEDRPLLSLVYTSLLALLNESFDNDLIRSVFEIKIISIEGELSDPPAAKEFLPGTIHALKYIESSLPDKLYTFNVNNEILAELRMLSDYYMRTCVHKEFSSLKVISDLTGT